MKKSNETMSYITMAVAIVICALAIWLNFKGMVWPPRILLALAGVAAYYAFRYMYEFAVEKKVQQQIRDEALAMFATNTADEDEEEAPAPEEPAEKEDSTEE